MARGALHYLLGMCQLVGEGVRVHQINHAVLALQVVLRQVVRYILIHLIPNLYIDGHLVLVNVEHGLNVEVVYFFVLGFEAALRDRDSLEPAHLAHLIIQDH